MLLAIGCLIEQACVPVLGPPTVQYLPLNPTLRVSDHKASCQYQFMSDMFEVRMFTTKEFILFREVKTRLYYGNTHCASQISHPVLSS